MHRISRSLGRLDDQGASPSDYVDDISDPCANDTTRCPRIADGEAVYKGTLVGSSSEESTQLHKIN